MKKKTVRKKKISRSKKMPSAFAFVIVSLLLAVSLGFAVKSIFSSEEQQVSGAKTQVSPTP